MVAVADVAGGDIPLSGGVNGLRMVYKDITLDSSYPTGGEALTAADLGLGSVLFLYAESASGYVFSYDRTNSKLLAYRGDNDNASDAPMIEVANTTNLATVVARFIAIGTNR